MTQALHRSAIAAFAALAFVWASVLVASPAAAVPVATTTQLNLRAAPGVGSPVIATMPAGEIVELRGCQGTWCFVVFRGQLGWASGRYLARVPFRAQPRGVPLLDWLAPRAEPPGARLPPPPGTALPRVVEPPPTLAPEPRRERRVRRPAPPQTPERSGRSTAPPGGGVLRDAAPVVTIPRPDMSPDAEDGPSSAPAPRAAPEAAREPPSRETGESPPRRLPRTGPDSGGSGSDML